MDVSRERVYYIHVTIEVQSLPTIGYSAHSLVPSGPPLAGLGACFELVVLKHSRYARGPYFSRCTRTEYGSSHGFKASIVAQQPSSI